MIYIGPSGKGGYDNYGSLFTGLSEHGLSAMEVPFTYGVRMKQDKAKEVGKLAHEHGIRLSIHAPYYVNLASPEEEKVQASKARILDSCRRAHDMGATHVVFHPGFYQKREPENVYSLIRDAMRDLMQTLREEHLNVTLAPETTGKQSQFGSLDELKRLMRDTGCSLCLDFAHVIARTGGTMSYEEMLEGLQGHIHGHFSGIEYSDKGERRHLDTEEKEARKLFEAILARDMDVTLINESPHPFQDAVMMQGVLNRITK